MRELRHPVPRGQWLWESRAALPFSPGWRACSTCNSAASIAMHPKSLGLAASFPDSNALSRNSRTRRLSSRQVTVANENLGHPTPWRSAAHNPKPCHSVAIITLYIAEYVKLDYRGAYAFRN